MVDICDGKLADALVILHLVERALPFVRTRIAIVQLATCPRDLNTCEELTERDTSLLFTNSLFRPDLVGLPVLFA